jgi:hypothetical protein
VSAFNKDPFNATTSLLELPTGSEEEYVSGGFSNKDVTFLPIPRLKEKCKLPAPTKMQRITNLKTWLLKIMMLIYCFSGSP